MAEITIPDGNINNIQVDGNSAGDIFNAALHNPEATGDIKAAIAAIISELRQQVANAQQSEVDNTGLRQQVATLTQQLADMTKDRDKWAKDNTDLRNAQVLYLTNTEAGQAALKQMQVQMTSATMLNLVEQLRGLGVDASEVATAIQSIVV